MVLLGLVGVDNTRGALNYVNKHADQNKTLEGCGGLHFSARA